MLLSPIFWYPYQKKEIYKKGGKRGNPFAVIGDRFPLLPQNIFFFLHFFQKFLLLAGFLKWFLYSGRSAVWFSAPALGAGGRRFESSRPDLNNFMVNGGIKSQILNTKS